MWMLAAKSVSDRCWRDVFFSTSFNKMLMFTKVADFLHFLVVFMESEEG